MTPALALAAPRHVFLQELTTGDPTEGSSSYLLILTWLVRYCRLLLLLETMKIEEVVREK